MHTFPSRAAAASLVREVARAIVLSSSLSSAEIIPASEGGKVVGKQQIRAYWMRQWREFDPHVEPLAISEEDEGRTRVRQHVNSLQRDNGLIQAMDLGDEADPDSGPSAAVARRISGSRKT